MNRYDAGRRKVIAGVESESASIVSLFEAQCRTVPLQPCVKTESTEFSFGEVDLAASQRARELMRRGVRAGEFVGILLERGAEAIISILSVLKLGAVFVPIDCSLPPSRIQYILQDANVNLCISRNIYEYILPEHIVFFSCDAEPSNDSAFAERFRSAVDPSSIAYCIYTSGSTGHPKGVLVQHRGVVNLLKDWAARVGDPLPSRGSWLTPMGFDVSVFEIFSALCLGATLFPVADRVRANPIVLVDYLRSQNIESAFLPRLALEELGMMPAEALRMLLVGVEPIPEMLLADIVRQSPSLLIVNGYGPTEATIYATAYERPRSVSRTTPIGTPIANVRVYLLDDNLRPVASGERGQIYIGGAGVALGYLNRPSLTAGAFIPEPHQDGQRMYRTGDYARYLNDGNLEFLGRVDNQVKVGGTRLELGEVEHAMRSLPGVSEVAVAFREQPHGLVAYVVLVDGALPFNQATAQRHLGRLLPTYMVPTAWVVLDRLPATPEGKIDRRALGTIKLVT